MIEKQPYCVVVDTQAQSAAQLQQWFSEQANPFQVHHAASVSEGRSAIQQLAPQMVLVDVDNLEGQALCAELKSNLQYAGILVCGLSDGWDPQSLASALFQPTRADYYFRRPLDGERLQQILSSAIDGGQGASLQTTNEGLRQAAQELASLQERYAAANEQNRAQQEEIVHLKAQMEQMTADAQAVSEQIGAHLEGYEGQSAAQFEQIGTLRAKLHAGQEELDKVQECLDAQLSKHTALEAEYGALQKAHQELKSNFERNQHDSKESKTEHRDLLAEYATLYDIHFEQNEELENLRNEIGGLRAAHEDLNSSLFDAQQRLVALQVEHVALLRAKEKSDIAAKTARAELETAQASIEQLEHNIAEVESEKQDILEAHGQTASSHRSLKEELEALNQDLQVLRSEKSDWQNRIAERDNELASAMHQLSDERAQNQINEQSILSYQSQLESFEQEGRLQASQIESLSEHLAQLQAEKETLQDSIQANAIEQEARLKEIDELRTKQAELTSELGRTRTSNSHLESRLEATESSNLTLQEQLEQTANALQEAQNASLSAYERSNQFSQEIALREGAIEQLQHELSELYKHQAELAEKAKRATTRLTTIEAEHHEAQQYFEQSIAERDHKLAEQAHYIDHLETDNINRAADQASKSAVLFERANRIRELERRVAEQDALQNLIERVYDEQASQLQQLNDALNSRQQMADGIREIEDQLSFSRMEIEDLHGTMTELQSAHFAEIDRLNQEMASERAALRADIDASTEQIQTLEAQALDREARYRELEKAHEEASAALSADQIRKAELRSELKTAQESYALAERQLHELAVENEAHTEEIASLKSIHQAQKQQYLEQSNQLNKLHGLFLQSVERQQALQEQVDAQTDSLRTLTQDNEAQGAEIAVLEAQLETAQNELELLKTQISEQQSEIEGLRQGELAEFEQIKSDLQQSQQLCVDLEQQLAEAQAEAEALGQEKGALQDAHDALHDRLEQQEAEQADKVAQEAQLTQALEQAREELGRLDAQRNSELRKSELLQSRFDALQALHDAHEAAFGHERAELQEKINLQSEQIKALKGGVPRFEASEPSEHSEEVVTAELAAAQASKDQLEAELAALKEAHAHEHQRLIDEVEALGQALEAAQADLEAARSNEKTQIDMPLPIAPETDERLEQLQSENAQVLTELEQAQAELSSAQLANEELKADLQRREEEHSETLRHLNQAHDADFEESGEQLSRAMADIDRQKAQIDELEQAVERLKGELESAQSASQSRTAELLAPERQHQALLMHLERAEADLDEAENQIEELEAELEAKEAELSSLRQTGSAHFDSIKEKTTSELVRLKQQLQEIEQENIIEIDAKVKALEAAHEQIDSMRANSDRADILEDLLSNAQAENNELSTQNEALHAELAELRKTLERAQNAPPPAQGTGRHASQADEISEMREHIEAYEAQVKEMAAHHKDEVSRFKKIFVEQSSDYEAQIQELQNELNLARLSDTKTDASAHDELLAQLEASERQLKQVTEDKASLEERHTELEGEAELLGQKLTEAMQAFGGYEAAQQELQLLRETVSSLEIELEQAQDSDPPAESAALAAAEARAAALAQEIEQLQREQVNQAQQPSANQAELQDKISELEHANRIAESTKLDVIRKAKLLKERASGSISALRSQLEEAQLRIAQLESKVATARESDDNQPEGDDDFDWNW